MRTKAAEKMVNGIKIKDLQCTLDSIKNNPEMAKSKFHIHNKWINGGHNRSEISSFYGACHEINHRKNFKLDADEPAIIAGTDKAANPVEHLLNALAGCVTSSIIYHAAVRGIRIEQLESELEGDLDLRGFTGLSDEVRKGYSNIRIKLKVKTDEEDLTKLKELANFSPVLDVVTHGTKVNISIERK